jgi:hypothetical protein
MSRRRKWGNEQTGLGGVGKIKVRLVDARTGPRGSDEEAHERGFRPYSKPLELIVNWF